MNPVLVNGATITVTGTTPTISSKIVSVSSSEKMRVDGDGVILYSDVSSALTGSSYVYSTAGFTVVGTLTISSTNLSPSNNTAKLKINGNSVMTTILTGSITFTTSKPATNINTSAPEPSTVIHKGTWTVTSHGQELPPKLLSN